MTDTLGVPTGALSTPTTVPITGGAQTGDLAHGPTQATNAAPELKTDPGTAVAVASGGGDVGLKALEQSRRPRTTSPQPETADGMKSGGFLGDIGHAVGAVGSSLEGNAKMLIGGATHLMNVPLRTVQQEYRYLHMMSKPCMAGTAAIEEGPRAAGRRRGRHGGRPRRGHDPRRRCGWVD